MKTIRILTTLAIILTITTAQASNNREETTNIDITIQSKGEKTIVDQCEEVYNTFKDYSKPDLIINGEGISIGKLIKNRCVLLFAIVVIIYLGIHIIKVLYNPEGELDKQLFVKPILLALFITLYNPMMNIADNLMYYISFRSFTKQNIQIVKETQEKQDYAMSSMMAAGVSAMPYYNPRNKNTDPITRTERKTATIAEILNGESNIDELQEEYIELLKAKSKIENGEAEEKDNMKILSHNLKQKSNSDAGTWVSDIIAWLSARICTIIRMMQTAMLSILFIGGPIAIVFEMIPIFKGSLSKWFGIYITTHLMTPIIFILDTARYIIFHSIDIENGATRTLTTLGISIAFLIVYIGVEKITSYFIQSAGGRIGQAAQTAWGIASAGASAAIVTAGTSSAGLGAATGIARGISTIIKNAK